MKYLIRFLLPCYLAILLLVNSVTPVFAAVTNDSGGGGTPSAPTAGTSNNFTGSLGEFQHALGGNQYGKELFDFQSLIGVMGSLTTLLVGCTDSSCPKSLTMGAIPTMGVAIAGIYANPPASGMYYLADTAERLNLIQPAYAQTGLGFNALQPFLAFWRAVRNLSYMLFVIGIVGLGLAIMFRSKISPQATITIQSALPRVIIALILITFSYAIVGFMIDLTYVFFGLLVWGLDAAGLYKNTGVDAQYFWNEYLNSNIATTFNFIFSKGIEGAGDIFRSGTLPSTLLAGAGLGAIVAAAIALANPITGPIALTIIGPPLVLFLLGLALAVIFFLFKVLFTLAKAYLMVIIYTIFAPFIILFNTLAGQGIWEGWLRGVVSNLLVFPVVGLVVFVVDVLRRQIDATWAGQTLWGPPYLGANSQIILNAIIALGAIMLIPTLPDIINQILGIRAVPTQLPNLERQAQQVSETEQQILRRRQETISGEAQNQRQAELLNALRGRRP